MIKAKTIYQILHKFWKLPHKEKRFLTEAVLMLFLAKLLLLILPFKTCLKFIQQAKNMDVEIDNQKLISIKNAINRANRLAFWKNKCLVMCFAARWMLMRRKFPSQFSIGFGHDKNKKFIAHAWIVVNDFEIVDNSLNYSELLVL